MSHFAKVINGIVDNVIVAEQDVIDSGVFGTGWIQTSYNTNKNQHPNGTPLRGNFAGIGFTYDKENDVFYPPSPYPSWILNTENWSWEPPEPYPTEAEGWYKWDEDNLIWSKA